MPYELTMTVRDARAQYFEDNNFGVDGGYGDKWVKLKLGPVPLVIPNTPLERSPCATTTCTTS